MTDALCLFDLDPNGRELDDPLEELYQDLVHRLIEPPGSNLDDPARGFGIEGRLSSGARKDIIGGTISRGIVAEFDKDNRVRKTTATVTSPAEGVYNVAIEVDTVEGLLNITLVKDGAGVRRVV